MTNEIILLYPLAFFFGLTVCILIIASAFGPSRSKVYRQDLSNMYVAGKIKQIAKKEGLDLNEEFLEFAKVTKNKKIDMQALDVTVERELQEKIADNSKTKDNNKSKSKD